MLFLSNLKIKTRDDIFGPVREIVADYSGAIKAINCPKINLNGFLYIT
jgi:hypothetical protein